jgi:predicted enzyme related to lactoylglutathione lyase
MARITGLGGLFFKSRDPAALAAWYRDVLGIATEEWNGSLLRYDAPGAPPHLVWAPFRTDTDYFEPSSREFMVNFAVDDLDAFIAQIAKKGVAVLGRNDDDPAGRFAWLVDPEGTKIELWQPAKTPPPSGA